MRSPQHPAGRITLLLQQHDSALELRVEDTGHGMPEEFVPHAFERFSRPDEARTSREGGSGLGLALVAALVDTADGSVAIENRRLNGVAVTVMLPER